MNIIVIGRTAYGKTNVAKALCEATGKGHIGMSDWVRKEFKSTADNRDDFVREISEYSIKELRKNPRRSVDYIYANNDFGGSSFVIEGIRNPHDFFELYKSGDIVIHINFCSAAKIGTPTSVFDEGVDIIGGYMDWATEIGLLPREKFLKCSFMSYDDAEEIVGIIPRMTGDITDQKLSGLVDKIVDHVSKLDNWRNDRNEH